MGRLKWTFHLPKDQFDLVMAFPEIYYCLPTFINRNLKYQALSHCLFWRPDPKEKRDKNAWYDNPQARTPYKSIGTSTRWGKFIEDILDCSAGKKIDTVSDAKNYIGSIKGFMLETPHFTSNAIKEYDSRRELYIYVLAIPISS